MRKTISRLPVLWLLVSLFACGKTASTPTPLPATSTVLPTSTPLPATPTDIPTPTPLPAPERARYTLEVTLDYAAKTVSVDENILYPNHTGETLNSLTLAVVPNLWAGGFALSGLSIDGAPVGNYALNGQRLEVPLPAPLAPERTLTLSLQFSLALPFAEQQDPSLERPRIYGYTARQINLVNWYPFIVPYQTGTGWILHDPWYYGEHLVYEAADYEVHLKTDPGVVVAASGLAQPGDEFTRYTLTAGRAFVLSASPEFQTVSAQAGNVTVTSYYFPLYEKPGQAVLDVSVKAVQLYSQRFGPYPHQTLAAVMGDFNDGMEYSAFYFLPRDFYNLYDGTPQNYLTFVAAHETSHQWWFERVANDQALHPWLDESLTNYCERLYYEAYHPELVSWWWSYRMYYYDPSAKVDIRIYDGAGFQPYTNATYFRGAHFLEDLRARIGDEAFFAFLQDYQAQLNGKIAKPQDFFTLLRQHTSVDFSDLMAAYFANPY